MKKTFFLIGVLFWASVCSCNKTKIASNNNSVIMNTYCALGASTSSLQWQTEVAKSVSHNYKCYSRYRTRWLHAPRSVLDLSDDAETIDNRTMTNQLARLLRDKEKSGYYPDLITIMCGLNDILWGINAIGSYSDAFSVDMSGITVEQWTNAPEYKVLRETMYGSMRFVVENLKRNFPKSCILMMTVQQVRNGEYNYENTVRVNKVIENVAKRYSIPIIDVFNESGITDMADLGFQFLQEDLVHPNKDGEKLLKKFVERKIRLLYISQK